MNKSTVSNKKDTKPSTQQPAPSKTPVTEEEEDEKSIVKTYRPPDNSSGAVLCIHTKPTLMKKLLAFLEHFDKPPQELFLEFAFVEVNEDDVAQFRYKLEHPILQQIYDQTQQAGFGFVNLPQNLEQSSMDMDLSQPSRLAMISQGNNTLGNNMNTSLSNNLPPTGRTIRNLPSSLTPRL